MGWKIIHWLFFSSWDPRIEIKPLSRVEIPRSCVWLSSASFFFNPLRWTSNDLSPKLFLKNKLQCLIKQPLAEAFPQAAYFRGCAIPCQSECSSTQYRWVVSAPLQLCLFASAQHLRIFAAVALSRCNHSDALMSVVFAVMFSKVLHPLLNFPDTVKAVSRIQLIAAVLDTWACWRRTQNTGCHCWLADGCARR